MNLNFNIATIKNVINIYNFHSTAHSELVFVNFYADWCRFSNLLAPIFDEAADKISGVFPDKTKVTLGRVDSDKHSKLLLFS